MRRQGDAALVKEPGGATLPLPSEESVTAGDTIAADRPPVIVRHTKGEDVSPNARSSTRVAAVGERSRSETVAPLVRQIYPAATEAPQERRPQSRVPDCTLHR